MNLSIVRNRRFKKLNQLKESGHYDEEQVMMRYPQLYYQFVGKYTRYQPKNYQAMSQFYQAQAVSSEYRKILQQKKLICEMEEDDGNQLSKSLKKQEKLEDIPQEQLQMHEQALLDHLQLLFLEGKDQTVDYSKIDENPQLDDLDILQQDAEQKYFNDDQNEGQEYNDPQNNTGIQDF